MEDEVRPTVKRDIWERQQREGVLDEKVTRVPTAPLAQKPDVLASTTGDDDNFSGGSTDDLIRHLERKIMRNKPLTDEQVERLRKRQRAEGVISGISDAVRSVANLIYTNKYAPDMYDSTKGMSAKSRERWDRFKADREAKDAEYYNDVMALQRYRDAQAEKEYQRGRDAIKDANNQAKADLDLKLADIKRRQAEQKLSDAEATAAEYEANKEYRDKINAAKLDTELSKAEKNRRPPVVSSGGGGRSNAAEHPWTDKDGKVHYVHSEAAARGNAATYGGTYLTTPKVETREVVNSVSTDSIGNKTTHNKETKTIDTSTKKKAIKGVTWK